MRLAVCLVFAIAIALPALPQNCDSSKMPESRTKAGDVMPPLSVTELSGQPFSIADLKGKVVLVNFWATWCQPCRREMPRMQKEIWERYRNAPNFAMVAIAREQTSTEVEDFREQSGFTFPMAADPKRTEYKHFADAGIPRSYVVAANGKILFQTEGYCSGDFDQLEKTIEQAVLSKPVESRMRKPRSPAQ